MTRTGIRPDIFSLWVSKGVIRAVMILISVFILVRFAHSNANLRPEKQGVGSQRFTACKIHYSLPSWEKEMCFGNTMRRYTKSLHVKLRRGRTTISPAF